MKPKSILRSFLIGSSLLAAPFTHADTLYWDGNDDTAGFGAASGTWTDPTTGTATSGWSTDSTGSTAINGNSVTTTTSDALNFGNGATGLTAGTITVAGTVSAGDMTYASGSGAIVLSGAGSTISLAATQTITTNAVVGTVNNIASTLSGAGTSFTKAGVGSLAYTSTATTFNPGSIAITGGILYIGNNTATRLNGGNYAGDVSIASGSTLRVWTTQNQTFSGVISGAGNVVKAYGGTLTLTGANTYTGKTSIDPQTTAGATLSVSSFDYITSGTYANHGLGSNLGAPTTVANGTIAVGSTGKQAGCSLTYTGTGETTDRVIQFNLNGTASQTLTANNASGLLKFTSNPLISGGVSGNVNLTGSGAGEISGNFPNVTSTGKLVINSTSTGSWTLSGNNIALTKGLTLTGGKLNINHANALGATASTFTIGAATFDNTSGAAITNANNNPIAWNGDSTFTGTNTLDLGTGAVTLGGNRSIVVSASTLTVGGVVGGGFNITLGGNGRLVLSNEASTYTGKTVVGNNAGSSLTLQVSKLADLSTNSSLGAPTTTATGLIQLGSASNSSTLDYIGTSASSTDRQVQVGSSSNGSGGAIINNNSVDPSHTLTFSNADFNVAATVSGFNRGLRLGGSNTGDNTISGVIIDNNPGLVSVTKQGDGKWILNGSSTYTGSTSVTAGVLGVSSLANLGVASNIGATANANGLVLNGGTLRYSGPAVAIDRLFSLRGVGTIESAGTGALTFNNTGSIGFGGTASSNTLTLGGAKNGSLAASIGNSDGVALSTAFTTGASTIDVASVAGVSEGATVSGTSIAPGTTVTAISGNTLTLSAVTTGTGAVGQLITLQGIVNPTHLVKSDSGTWTLSGSHSYVGTTAINAGTLAITGATLATSAITVGASGSLGLDIANSITASAATVTLGGTVTIIGTPADPTSYTLLTASSITGTATLATPISGYSLVIEDGVSSDTLKLAPSGSPVGYAAWQAANGGTTGGLGDDHDNDGVDNGTEFFIGGTNDTTGFTTPLPTVVNTSGTLSVTWVRHPDYPGFPANYGTAFVVETSDTLTGTWTQEDVAPTPGANVTITGNNVTYTFPGGPAYSGKNFARLKVTGP